jgi:hypothetical protein
MNNPLTGLQVPTKRSAKRAERQTDRQTSKIEKEQTLERED